MTGAYHTGTTSTNRAISMPPKTKPPASQIIMHTKQKIARVDIVFLPNGGFHIEDCPPSVVGKCLTIPKHRSIGSNNVHLVLNPILSTRR